MTDEDRARLQPLIDRTALCIERGATLVCEITDSIDGRLEILQGYCEELGNELREGILKQVDRGEWRARGITRRDELSITIHVDARAAFNDPDANLLHLSMLPTEHLS